MATYVANRIAKGPAATSKRKPVIDSPALQLSQRLVQSYDLFNADLFDGRLPPVMLQLRNKPGCYGYFQPNKWSDRDGRLIDVITLDSETATDRPLEELLSTLVHEMAHAYVFHCTNGRASTGGHGPQWRKEMERIGLPPVRIGLKWKHATHSIDPNGSFHAVFLKHRKQLQDLPWRECIGASSGRASGPDRVRFQCPHCTFNVWAKPAGLPVCGFCSTPEELVFMLSDQGTAVPPSAAGGTTAKGARPHYSEPRGVVGLPVWTDELGRELRLHTGIDHPPQDLGDALLVLTFGVMQRRPEIAHNLPRALESKDQDAIAKALKELYIHRCQVLHPDVEGGSEISFKALQTAYRTILPPKKKESYDSDSGEDD